MDFSAITNSLAKTARVLSEDDQPNTNPELQAIVGDPDDTATSTFAQHQPNPGTMQLPNPLSPLEGDDVFFTYMIPGSRFQDHKGHEWMIQNYGSPDEIEIYDVWYPAHQGIVSISDIRRSIHQWTSPIQQVVPPPPPGVDYAAEPVRVMGDTGAADALIGKK